MMCTLRKYLIAGLLVWAPLAATILIVKLVGIWENVLGLIPLVRNIYNAFRQITHSILSSGNKSFRRESHLAGTVAQSAPAS